VVWFPILGLAVLGVALLLVVREATVRGKQWDNKK
jgi:hypothetical protein